MGDFLLPPWKKALFGDNFAEIEYNRYTERGVKKKLNAGAALEIASAHSGVTESDMLKKKRS